MRDGGVIGTVLMLAAAYLMVVALMFAFQRNLQYFPDPTTPDPARYGVPDMTAVTAVAADGLEIASWYAPPADETRPTVVYFHGNGGNLGLRAGRARALLDAGYGVLLAGYRGYGGNPGDPTEAGLMADGRGVLAWLAERGTGPSRVVLYGESLGSGVAVVMAAEGRGAAMILESAFSSAVDVAAGAYWWLPVRLLMRDRFDSASRIGEVRIPILFVHGEEDWIVPIKLGRRLFASANEPKQFIAIPGGGHNDLDRFGLPEVVLGFLGDLTSEDGDGQLAKP